LDALTGGDKASADDVRKEREEMMRRRRERLAKGANKGPGVLDNLLESLKKGNFDTPVSK
jgi:hypothetical protein